MTHNIRKYEFEVCHLEDLANCLAYLFFAVLFRSAQSYFFHLKNKKVFPLVLFPSFLCFSLQWNSFERLVCTWCFLFLSSILSWTCYNQAFTLPLHQYGADQCHQQLFMLSICPDILAAVGMTRHAPSWAIFFLPLTPGTSQFPGFSFSYWLLPLLCWFLTS